MPPLLGLHPPRNHDLSPNREQGRVRGAGGREARPIGEGATRVFVIVVAEIVNFIVRAVDDILKERFGIPDGLADHKRVTVLDFACGTGTFILEVFERIFENTGGADSAKAGLIVRDHMLEKIFGFEYLIAPYTIAHLKLSQYLSDQGHSLQGNERLQVFLTNTLEPIEPQANFLLPAISAEVEAAQAVKDREILVIVGNPPYSGVSRNMGAAAQRLIE
jgi:predicted helicase